ncbi:MAG: UbiD family decarboxylase, partial [Bacillota bacterium]
YAATAPLPRDMDEMVFAGFLRKAPVNLVKCETVDLEVPADAEYILEGYVDPEELRLEGPFGDHTGYYSQAARYPVFHVTCITHRKNPVYPATIVGKPPMEDCYLGKATERLFLPLLQLNLPEIVDLNLPLEGVFHNCAIISIKKAYPAHAKKIMNAVWGMGQMMFTKMVIIVDEHVDVHDLSEVWWRVYNNIDAARDVVIMEGPLDALDHASPYAHFGAKMGIDATRAWCSEGYTRAWPEEITMSEEIKRRVDEKWEGLGIG